MGGLSSTYSTVRGDGLVPVSRNVWTGVAEVVAAVVVMIPLVVVYTAVVLTVRGQSLRAAGEADDVSVSFQDENLVVTTRHRHNVSAALQRSDYHLDTSNPHG